MEKPEDLFVKLDELKPGEFNALYENYNNVGLMKTSAYNRTFNNYDTNISIKSDYRRQDYDYFRTADAVPNSPEQILNMCMNAYAKIGIVRNVIDLMSDFACQGIRIQHPVKVTEKFLNSWFRKVKGKERSERFLNLLYRSANVIIYTMYGKVPAKIVKKWKSAKGDIQIQEMPTEAKKIPLQYSFLNPTSVEIIGGDFSSLSDKSRYALKLTNLKSLINGYGLGDEVVQTLFEEVKQGVDGDLLDYIKKGKKYFPLPQDRVSAYFYKKDDWKVWAEPMVYPILSDLVVLEKMKLADISALDGAISNVRLWNLGHLDGAKSIMPTAAGISKLQNILAQGMGGGTIELVWGPELKFTESATSVHQFLGGDKYKPILDAIYDGLGIPQTLRSGSTNTNTNSVMALKTLIERLQYARDVLLEFWNEQLKIVQKAMGFKEPGRIVFENMTLSDEAAEKKLLMDLADRNIISDESLREKFNLQDDIEAKRIRRELKKRTADTTPNKASPFHNPQFEDEVKKGLVNTGFAAPSEVGINLKDKTPQDNDRQAQFVKRQQDMKPKGENSGRPRNITETKKRKPKPKNKPRTNGSAIALLLWTDKVQEQISDIITPSLLHAYGRKNVRSMTNEEVDFLENIKLKVLFSLEPFQEITAELIFDKIDQGFDNDYYTSIYASINKIKNKCMTMYNKNLTIDELRKIYSEVFISLKGDNGEI